MYNRELNCQVMIRDGITLAELNDWTERSRWSCILLGGMYDRYYISKKTFSIFVCFDNGYTSIEVSRTKFPKDYRMRVPYYKRAKLIERINTCLFNTIFKEQVQ